MKLIDYLKINPNFLKNFPYNIDTTDTNYIVRIDSNNYVEFGYSSDNWVIH